MAELEYTNAPACFVEKAVNCTIWLHHSFIFFNLTDSCTTHRFIFYGHILKSSNKMIKLE